MNKDDAVKRLKEFRVMGREILQHENDKVVLELWLDKATTDDLMFNKTNEKLIAKLNKFIANEQAKIDELKEHRKQTVLLLKEIEAIDSNVGLVLQLIYIGGLTHMSVAKSMHISPRSVVNYSQKGLEMIGNRMK